MFVGKSTGSAYLIHIFSSDHHVARNDKAKAQWSDVIIEIQTHTPLKKRKSRGENYEF